MTSSSTHCFHCGSSVPKNEFRLSGVDYCEDCFEDMLLKSEADEWYKEGELG